jgi:GH15 family glucan-1,4-alpha-glucosidase
VEDVSGWAGSTPVRVGNDATQQRQLDSITTILDAISVHIRCGGRASRRTWDLVEHLADLLVEAPFAPSSGIWEMRTPQRLVSEELARWIGLETALRLRAILRPWKRRPLWRVARDAARARVEASFDRGLGMLPQSFDGPFIPDASALLACIHGFFPRHDPRARRLALSTVAALEQGSFLRRYPPIADEFEGTEATFLPASWWAVSALAAVGETDAARLRADDMCAQLPPLLSEEWDVEQRICLGNTPLLWSHTEAARALYNLHTARIRKRFGVPGVAVYNVSRYVRIRFLRRPGS